MVNSSKYEALTKSESTRDQILNAAMICLIQYGPERANISSIASLAGVSRPTVYAHFENLDELVQESIVRGTTLLCNRLLENARHHSDPRDRLVAAFMELLTLSEDIDILRTPVDYAIGIGVGRADDGSIMQQAVEVAMAIFDELLGDNPPEDHDLEEMAETVIRFFLSLAKLKRPTDKQDDIEGYVRRVVLPAVGYAPLKI